MAVRRDDLTYMRDYIRVRLRNDDGQHPDIGALPRNVPPVLDGDTTQNTGQLTVPTVIRNFNNAYSEFVTTARRRGIGSYVTRGQPPRVAPSNVVRWREIAGEIRRLERLLHHIRRQDGPYVANRVLVGRDREGGTRRPRPEIAAEARRIFAIIQRDIDSIEAEIARLKEPFEEGLERLNRRIPAEGMADVIPWANPPGAIEQPNPGAPLRDAIPYPDILVPERLPIIPPLRDAIMEEESVYDDAESFDSRPESERTEEEAIFDEELLADSGEPSEFLSVEGFEEEIAVAMGGTTRQQRIDDARRIAQMMPNYMRTPIDPTRNPTPNVMRPSITPTLNRIKKQIVALNTNPRLTTQEKKVGLAQLMTEAAEELGFDDWKPFISSFSDETASIVTSVEAEFGDRLDRPPHENTQEAILAIVRAVVFNEVVVEDMVEQLRATAAFLLTENFIFINNNNMDTQAPIKYSDGFGNINPDRPISHRFIHVNSRHIEFNNSRTDFTIYLTNPIKNVKQVALKSFSVPNTANNIAPNHPFSWVEAWYDDVGTTAANIHYRQYTSAINVPVIGEDAVYLSSNDLATAMVIAMGGDASSTNATNRKFDMTQNLGVGEDSQIYSMVWDSISYKTTVTTQYSGATAPGYKWWAPVYSPDQNHVNLWNMLGYEQDQLLELPAQQIETGQFFTGVTLTDDSFKLTMRLGIPGQPLSTALLQVAGGATVTNAMRQEFKPFVSAGEGNLSKNISVTDNPIGYFITSDLTDNSALETHRQIQKNVAVPTNILEWILNTSGRNTYLHYTPDMISWHRLHQPQIAQFTIKVLNYEGRNLPHDMIRDFQMVLVVEVEEELDYHEEVVRKQQRSAYREMHDPDVIRGRK